MSKVGNHSGGSDSGGDIYSAEKRSELMSRVRSKNTKPEMAVRSLLHGMGYRFRLHRKDLPGNPDIVLPKYRSVIFVHGCFWHQHSGCSKAKIPERNKDYWEPKLNRNVQRDSEAQRALAESGWGAMVLWECEINSQNPMVLRKIRNFLQSAEPRS